MKALVKSSVVISSTELAIILIGIIRSKYLAMHIGPEGLGLYSLLSSFFMMATSICSGWFSIVYIKYVAEYKSKGYSRAVEIIHNFSYSITCILVAITITLLVLFKSLIINAFLTPEILDFHYAIFSAVFAVNSFKLLYDYHLNANSLYKRAALARFLISIFEIISIIILVYFFSLSGFFISLLFTAIFGLIIFRLTTRNQVQSKFNFSLFKSPLSKEITKYGSVNFILLLLGNSSQYLYRLLIINTLTFSHVGFFHALSSLVNYLGVFNKGTNYLYAPMMGRDLSNKERNKSLDDYLRLNITVGVIICTLAILFFDQLIILFFTSEFTSITKISHFFIIAQFLTIPVVALQTIIVGTNRYFIHSIVVIGTNILWIATPFLLINDLGIVAIAAGMIAASVWSISVNLIYLRYTVRTKVSPQVIIGLILSFVFFALSIYLKNSFLTSKVILILIELFVMSYFISEQVKIKVYDRIKMILTNDK